MSIIGIDLGGTKISAGLVKQSKIVKAVAEPTNKGCVNDVVIQIKSILQKLINKDVEAIGIGAPSIVDTKKGIIFEVSNIPSWKKVFLADLIGQEFDIPVYINNDANCFALAEKHYGKAKKYNDIVGVTIGTGLGVGIVINGKLYNGHNCGAGEFCNIPYLNNTLEYYCSGNFFKTVYKIDGATLYKKALAGDSKSIKIFNEFGDHIGVALAVIVLSIDPEIIVLGGSVSKSSSFFWDSMINSLKKKIYTQTFKTLIIKKSSIKEPGVLGAASLRLNK